MSRIDKKSPFKVPDGYFNHFEQKLAQKIESKLGSAVKIGKEAFYKQIAMPLDQAYRYTGDAMVENMLHRDTEEGVSAFIEKRDPKWEQ